jgi:ABC-type sugar transport system substrate-binding protein
MNELNRRNFLMGTTALAAVSVVGLGVAPAMAKSWTIAGIVFQQDQFFRTIQIGMEAAAKDAGATLLEANSENKPEKEASLIDTYIARKVDAIVISPLSTTASEPAIKRAVDAGIKVVTYNSAVDGDLAASYLNSSQRDLGTTSGKAAAAYITAKLGGKAKIATIAFKALIPEVSADRVDSFLDAVKDGNTIDLVSQQDAWLAEKAVAVAGDIITANPDLQVIYAANEGGTVGAVQAVRNANMQGKIVVFGIDGTDQLAQMLLDDDNVLQAVTAQQPYVMGSLAVKAALDVLNGKPVEKKVIVPVLGLNRDDPDAVKKFREDLKTLK